MFRRLTGLAIMAVLLCSSLAGAALDGIGLEGMYSVSGMILERRWEMCDLFGDGLLCRERIYFEDYLLEERIMYLTADSVHIVGEIEPSTGEMALYSPYIPVIVSQSGSYTGQFTKVNKYGDPFEVGIWSSDITLFGGQAIVASGMPRSVTRYVSRMQFSDSTIMVWGIWVDDDGFPLRFEREVWENSVIIHKATWNVENPSSAN